MRGANDLQDKAIGGQGQKEDMRDAVVAEAAWVVVGEDPAEVGVKAEAGAVVLTVFPAQLFRLQEQRHQYQVGLIEEAVAVSKRKK